MGIDESMAEAAAEREQARQYWREQRLARGERVVEHVRWGLNQEPRTRVTWLNRQTGQLEYADYPGHITP